MTVFLIALLACFIVVASFALGGFLGLYAGSKGMFPHKTIKEEKPEDEGLQEGQFILNGVKYQVSEIK